MYANCYYEIDIYMYLPLAFNPSIIFDNFLYSSVRYINMKDSNSLTHADIALIHMMMNT